MMTITHDYEIAVLEWIRVQRDDLRALACGTTWGEFFRMEGRLKAELEMVRESIRQDRSDLRRYGAWNDYRAQSERRIRRALAVQCAWRDEMVEAQRFMRAEWRERVAEAREVTAMLERIDRERAGR